MERLVFMGTPDFAVPVLKALIGRYEIAGVVTQPDRRAKRGRKLEASPVKVVALAHDLPVLQPPRLRQPDVAAELEDLAPDVIVVAAYGQILPAQVLAIPPRGCLNVHASLLPKYRGAAPVAAAILAGEEETGVTIMLMDEGMDTGPILSQATCAISPQDT
ncbi:MAG: methionyl-tRNA formyltransferase, partial [Anaerolineae bacterium]